MEIKFFFANLFFLEPASPEPPRSASDCGDCGGGRGLHFLKVAKFVH